MLREWKMNNCMKKKPVLRDWLYCSLENVDIASGSTIRMRGSRGVWGGGGRTTWKITNSIGFN